MSTLVPVKQARETERPEGEIVAEAHHVVWESITNEIQHTIR